MKRSPLLAVLSLLLASHAPAAELFITPETLNPSSTLELRFETPMVDKARVGSVEKDSPLVGDPAVAGEFKWTSTRSGQFRFTEPPRFATTYKFALREGLKDAAGKEVEVEEFDECKTEGFRLVNQWREYPYYGQIGIQQRVPRYLLQFSDTVVPSDAAEQMSFVSKAGVRVAAKARLATGKDFRRHGYVEYAPTWDELVAGVKPQPKPDEARPNALLIESREPLPLGESWTLLVPGSFANQGGKALWRRKNAWCGAMSSRWASCARWRSRISTSRIPSRSISTNRWRALRKRPGMTRISAGLSRSSRRLPD